MLEIDTNDNLPFRYHSLEIDTIDDLPFGCYYLVEQYTYDIDIFYIRCIKERDNSIIFLKVHEGNSVFKYLESMELDIIESKIFFIKRIRLWNTDEYSFSIETSEFNSIYEDCVWKILR